MRMRIAMVVATLVLLLLACDDGDDAITLVDAPQIGSDLPVVDGSTSTLPLRSLVVCTILRKPCQWSSLTGIRTIAPVNDVAREPFRDAVRSSGTHGSYVALTRGEADLIITARTPNEEEVELATAAGLAFDIEPIALDAFVFLVNDSNRVDSLDLDQIRAIFSGAIIDWDEVGGDDRRIQPYQRNPTSGSQVLMEALVMQGVSMVDAPNLMLPSMSAPFDAISRDTDGIGYSVFYFATQMLVHDGIKLLDIEGVPPSKATISSGEYPLVTEVYAVMTDSAPPDSGARVVRDWLATETGQEVIGMSGYVPNR